MTETKLLCMFCDNELKLMTYIGKAKLIMQYEIMCPNCATKEKNKETLISTSEQKKRFNLIETENIRLMDSWKNLGIFK